MKQFRQLQFIELNTLMGKFSPHIDERLVRTLFEEYKKYLLEVHYKFPHNEVLATKVKEIKDIEGSLGNVSPGELKAKLQQQTTDVIMELDNISLSN